MKQIWKQRMIQGLWIAIGISTIVLLGAAMQQKNHKTCSDIKIEIIGAVKHMFIDEHDVLQILNRNQNVVGTEMANIDIRTIEEMLEKNPWVLNAEMFFDNKQVLNVSITERQPIARIFTVQGNSFYIDSSCNRLPLSEKLSARVPVFTNFTNSNAVMSHGDSVLLKDVSRLGAFIMADSFFMAQTAQIDITPGGKFEIIPVMGNHIVTLGNATDLENKFNRLYTFYKQAWLQNGMNKYERIDVQFDNQVVALKRNASKVFIDSTKALQTLNGMMLQQGILDSVVTNIITEKKIPINTTLVKDSIKTKPAKVENKIKIENKNKTETKNKINKPQSQQPKALMQKN
jgi:cell division protein FtsQ